MASPYGWGYTPTVFRRGPPGPLGPTGPFAGRLQNDNTFGAASVQLLDDADNTWAGPSFPGSDYLNYVNALNVVPYQQGGTGPVNLAITEQSVYDVIQSIAPSQNQAGPFQVNTPSGPTGAIVEIAGGLALAYGAIQGLAQSVPLTTEAVDTGLYTGANIIPTIADEYFGYSTRPSSGTGPVASMYSHPDEAITTQRFVDGTDEYYAIMGTTNYSQKVVMGINSDDGVAQSNVSCSINGSHVPEWSVVYLGNPIVAVSAGLSQGFTIYSTAEGSTGTALFNVDINDNLIQCQSSQFALGTYFIPTGSFTGTAAQVRNASFVVATDLSSDVYVELPSDRPAGTIVFTKKNSTQNNHVRVVVEGGGLIDGSATYDQGNNDYTKAGFGSLGNGNWVVL